MVGAANGCECVGGRNWWNRGLGVGGCVQRDSNTKGSITWHAERIDQQVCWISFMCPAAEDSPKWEGRCVMPLFLPVVSVLDKSGGQLTQSALLKEKKVVSVGMFWGNSDRKDLGIGTQFD